MREVYVAFSGKADVWWLRFLKAGFRHCFAIVREEHGWLVIDPLLHKMDVLTASQDPAFDMPQWLRARGYRVVKATVSAPPMRALYPAPFTCVEAVKRLIGLQAWAVFTPWQLYRRLLSLNTI
ncbi:MAG: hypothetical protein KGQ41_05420 [Alphaproteobacteria bacterium]|nr:hypothetical protein [Alphaproteobacteria bacterium]